MVPDTLSRDAVRKPLCQRCYGALGGEAAEAATRHMAESVRIVTEVGITGAGVSIEEVRAAQSAEFGNVSEAAAEDKLMLVDEEGILRIAKDGDLAVVVPKSLQLAVLNHVMGQLSPGTIASEKHCADEGEVLVEGMDKGCGSLHPSMSAVRRERGYQAGAAGRSRSNTPKRPFRASRFRYSNNHAKDKERQYQNIGDGRRIYPLCSSCACP